MEFSCLFRLNYPFSNHRLLGIIAQLPYNPYVMQQHFQTTLDEFKHLSLSAEEQILLKGGNGENDEDNANGIVTEEEIVN